jgi:hypothetical protein
MNIIHSPERASEILLNEIIHEQDLPIYLVKNYMATTKDNDPESDPEFTVDEIIPVLRLVLLSGLVYFVPGHRKVINKNIPVIAHHGRLQEDIWYGKIDKIVDGIRYQLENWDWPDQGYFIPKQKAQELNKICREKYGYDRFVFVEPTDDTIKQPLKYE